MHELGFQDISEQRPRKYLLGGLGALAAAGALFGAIHFGPKAIEDLTTKKSEVVEGVPGLVVGYDSRRVWTGKFFIWKYWLEIEQCPTDIDAAEKGATTQSFSSDTSQISPGCFEDWALVSGDTFSSYAIGSTVEFDGSPSEHLRK